MPHASRTIDNLHLTTDKRKLAFQSKSTVNGQMSNVQSKSVGFTLIELLIVITILAILAASIMIAINPAKRKGQARDATRKSDIGQIGNVLKAYYTEKDTYPAGSGPASSSGLTSLVPGDLKSIPKDPLNVEYQYTVSGSGVNSEAAIYATLEDPTSGGGTWLWCFRSASFNITEVTGGSCTP